MPVGSIFRSISNLRRWRGAEVNALNSGRVPVSIGSMKSGVMGVKSRQVGFSSLTLSGNGTSTINLPTTVNTAKSIFSRQLGGSTGYDNHTYTLNASSISITNSGSRGRTVRIEWQVVEWY